jgi:hypothetical protein
MAAGNSVLTSTPTSMARLVPTALLLGAWPDVTVGDFVPGGRPGWPGVTRGIRAVEGGFELKLAPLGWVTCGALMWPWEHAHRILDAWAECAQRLPAAAATAGRLVRVPNIRGVPAALRGRSWVAVEAAIPGDPCAAAGMFSALRRLKPEIDKVALGGTRDLLALPAGMPAPRATVGAHVALRELPDAALDAFIVAAGPGSGSNLLSAELHRVDAAGSAFALSAIGAPTHAEDAERLEIQLHQLQAALAPWAFA